MSNRWKTKRISPKSHKKNIKSKIVKFLFLSIIAFILYYIAGYVLPRVDVVLIPKSREISVNKDIYLVSNQSVNIDDFIYIKGKNIVFNEEAENEFDVEGEKNIGERAEGEVVFYNYTGLSYDLMPEDSLETSDGVFFVVSAPLVIPPATVSINGDIVPGKINAVLKAVEPGEEGNIKPQKIFITSLPVDKQLKIYAQADNDFTGGTTKMAKVVSEDDIEKAKEKLRDILKTKIVQKAETVKKDSEVVLKDFIVFDEEEYATEIVAGDEIESFTMSLKAKARVFVYNQKDLYKVLKEQVSLIKLPEEILVGDEPSTLNINEVIKDDFTNSYIARIESGWLVSNPIDLDEIKQSIIGKKESEARRVLLSNPSINDVVFIWDLAFRKYIPNIESHINIKIK